MKTFTMALMAAATMLASPAHALVLVADSGWQDDTIEDIGPPSNQSPIEFTLTGDAYFRLTDAFLTGDVYTADDAGNALSFTSTFTTDGAPVEDYFGTAWNDTSFSRFSALLGAGTYSFTITGDCTVGGCPAGFAVRLDTVVPEPTTWALMMAGFGLAGGALRRRQNVATRVNFA